jgi:hypothetical protein
MSQQLLNLGSTAGDGTGDTLHSAGVKINANFSELYSVNVYTPPVASTSVSGTVKVDGTSITINGSGVISANVAALTGTALAASITTSSLTSFGTSPTLNSPILVTPTLGVATGTSVALGGATIGSNALAVNGTTNFNGTITFADGSTYGTGGLTMATGKTINASIFSGTTSTFTGTVAVTSGLANGVSLAGSAGNAVISTTSGNLTLTSAGNTLQILNTLINSNSNQVINPTSNILYLGGNNGWTNGVFLQAPSTSNIQLQIGGTTIATTTSTGLNVSSGLANSVKLLGSATTPTITTSANNLVIAPSAGVTYFTGSGVFSSVLTASAVTVSANSPASNIVDTSVGTDLKNWRFYLSSGNFYLQTMNDAYASVTNAYVITRGTTYNVSSHNWFTSTTAGAPVLGMQMTNNGIINLNSSVQPSGTAVNLLVGATATRPGGIQLANITSAGFTITPGSSASTAGAILYNYTGAPGSETYTQIGLINSAGQLQISSGLANSITITGSATNPTISTSGGNLFLTTAASGAIYIAPAGGSVLLQASGANFNIMDSALGTDLKSWRVQLPSGNYNLLATNDSLSAVTSAYTITRGTTYNVAGHTWYTSTTAGTAVQGMQLTTSAFSVGVSGNKSLGVDAAMTAKAAADTTGYPMMATCTTTPTGVPTGGAGAYVVDTTNKKLWIYTGAAWVGVVLA